MVTILMRNRDVKVCPEIVMTRSEVDAPDCHCTIAAGEGAGLQGRGADRVGYVGPRQEQQEAAESGGGSIVSESVWSDISYSFIFIFVSIMKKNKKMITSLGTTITKPNLPPEA